MMSKSIRNLRKNIEETKLTINSFLTCLSATIVLEEWLTGAGRNPFKEESIGREMKKHIDHAKNSEDGLYEMAFVKVFAYFESFMYEFLIEKYKKFPGAIDSTTKLDFETIRNIKSITELKRNIFDEAAVSDSWTIEKWEAKLKEKFKISVFRNSNDREIFLILNEARNAVLHSNGRATMKALKTLKSLNAPSLEHGEKILLKNKDLLNYTSKAIYKLLENIEPNQK